MPVHTLETTQQLPVALKVLWEFIASPANLKVITPDYMGFDILTPNLPAQMYPGMIITYRVRPLFGLPVQWVTEITNVREPYFFVDEQREGPYSFWHHKHYLREIEGGVEMSDIVHYKLPFTPLSELMHPFIVRRKLNEIFNYRYRKLEEMFGAMEKVAFSESRSHNQA